MFIQFIICSMMSGMLDLPYWAEFMNEIVLYRDLKDVQSAYNSYIDFVQDKIANKFTEQTIKSVVELLSPEEIADTNVNDPQALSVLIVQNLQNSDADKKWYICIKRILGLVDPFTPYTVSFDLFNKRFRRNRITLLGTLNPKHREEIFELEQREDLSYADVHDMMFP